MSGADRKKRLRARQRYGEIVVSCVVGNDTIDDISAYFQRTMKTFMGEAMIAQLKCDRDALNAEADRLKNNVATLDEATPSGPVLTVVKSDI
jgi:predicted ester cyclase